MYLIPAIDILSGKCVRLVQGEYHKYINYESQPEKKAVEFKAAGADWLHIIDLDGARLGKCVNTDAVRAIVKQAQGLKIQIGGGIRDEDSIKKMLDMGAARIIIGTRAVNDSHWLQDMCHKFKDQIVVSLDARGNKIATDGWKKDSQDELTDIAKQIAANEPNAIIYTDINKDGMLSGPNIERTKALAQSVNVPVIAAGGVTTIEDVRALSATGSISAAIVGRALYENTLNLAEAIKFVKSA